MTNDLSELNDDEILFRILVIADEVNSFCPECLIHSGTHSLFSEAYRRFHSWDSIIDQCVKFSNTNDFYNYCFMSSSEILLEILKLENKNSLMDESSIMKNHSELHHMAIMIFGSWHRALAISGIKVRKKRVGENPSYVKSVSDQL